MGRAQGYELCSGCGICLLVCPVWRRTRSMSYTRKARARAMQGGATPEEIAASIDACLMCGSCEPACPEGIGIVAINIEMRRKLNRARTSYPAWYPSPNKDYSPDNNGAVRKAIILLPGERLGSDKEACGAVIKLLGGDNKVAVAEDDGRDIAKAFEAGFSIADDRMNNFMAALRPANTIVAAEGLLHHPLKKMSGRKKVMGLGEALLKVPSVRGALGKDDLYVIESRCYHSDYERLVRFYDRLQRDTGCRTNLDLQRIAMPTGASSLQAAEDIEAAGCTEQARWILKGRKVGRIVVEDLADREVFQRVTEIPAIHISQLAAHGPDS